MSAARIALSYTEPQLDIFFGPAKRFNAVAKGRRFGATRGAAHACIEWAIEGQPILWGDTVHGNIIRYVDRYFLPALKSIGAAGIAEWRQQDKVLKIGEGYIDFRSADRPENWEGFGYRKLVLNEAGIILADPYLFSNAVLPMMMDYPEAQLFALGVPKGMRLNDGSDHPFYRLHNARSDEHRSLTFSTYDNPLLSEEDIELTVKEIAAMSPEEVDQEIWGKFLDRSGGVPFAHAFNEAQHVRACELDPRQPVIASLDFNVDPFTCIIGQVRAGGAEAVITHEIAIRSGTISEMAERIRSVVPSTHNLFLTGDRTGAARRIGAKTTASLWDDLVRELRLREAQLRLPANPSHIESREQVNYALAHHKGLAIHPRCKGLIMDLKVVQFTDGHHIEKADRSQASQRADLLDCFRYFVNAYLWDWIKRHRQHAVLNNPSGRPDQPVR